MPADSQLDDVFFHNIFVHVPDHVDPQIPWYHLPEAALAIEAAFPGTVINWPWRLAHYVCGTRQCKLYDFGAGRWMPYADATL